MIDDDSRYFCLSGDIPFGWPSPWHVIDWDQRRVVSDPLSHVGDIISTYTDAENDQTYCTVRRDELEELERLGPDVDLVAYPPCLGGSAKKVRPRCRFLDYLVVFKYYFLWQYAYMSWKEMNLCMHLPRHPNIVPLDRIVMDELEGRVVGFTNDYLIKVVDDLNLGYGIAHQDIAPRNPLGAIFTTYEIITRDNRVRIKHPQVRLDHPVASYQLLLQEWQERRRAGDLHAAHSSNVLNAIDWPSRPKPPQQTMSLKNAHGQPVDVTSTKWFERRQDVRVRGGKVLDWERPPQRILDDGTQVLSSGEIISG
ncbi:hypothetical protein B0H63DRAFT_493371 [Podospora didyma]|uniref:Uncharacterized protein n=1 Tax=Podospora didyma TaxID=330526 RepID=A0AAE0NSC9_9PEZI|nr:hypothetical protein B0H63DRAFT_493371 [Podospora didyma]